MSDDDPVARPAWHLLTLPDMANCRSSISDGEEDGSYLVGCIHIKTSWNLCAILVATQLTESQ